jgi:hypothetical protein
MSRALLPIHKNAINACELYTLRPPVNTGEKQPGKQRGHRADPSNRFQRSIN